MFLRRYSFGAPVCEIPGFNTFYLERNEGHYLFDDLTDGDRLWLIAFTTKGVNRKIKPGSANLQLWMADNGLNLDTPFHYQSLSSDASEIRLARLQPGSLEGDIRIRLYHDSFTNRPKYTALVCPQRQVKETIRIFVNNYPLDVPSDAVLAIQKHFLTQPSDCEDEGALVWIDTLCIDHDNLQERYQQMSRIHSIYGNAAKIIYWTGSTQDDGRFGSKRRKLTDPDCRS